VDLVGDVLAAVANTVEAENSGTVGPTRERIRRLLSTEPSGQQFVTKILGQGLKLR